jgi:hypothetical protein
LYCGGVNGARPADVKKLINAIQSKGPRSSENTEIHSEPQQEWTHMWARSFLSEQQLRDLKEQEQAFSQIDEKWQRFLDEDCPKIRSIVTTLYPLLGARAK